MSVAVGLDIGTSSIKVAEIRRVRGRYVLTKVGKRATPYGAIKSGVIVKREEVAAELRALLRELKLRPRNVVTAVAGQSVIVRTLMLPPMSREEMAEAIRWEMDSQLPYAVDESVYDFDVISETADESGNPLLKVGLVAARKEIVNSFIDTLRLCRIVPKIIDVQPFAILRSLSMSECAARSPGDQENNTRTRDGSSDRLSYLFDREAAAVLDDSYGASESAASSTEIEFGASPTTTGYGESVSHAGNCMVALDIGAGTTDVVVNSDDDSIFTRIIPSGGDSITTAIADSLVCSREEAESLKRRVDWINGIDLQTGKPADKAAVSAIEVVVRNLASEIRRTIQFYNAQHPERQIRGGVLSGGGAKLFGLAKYLSHQLEIPMTMGNPYARVDIDRRLLYASLQADAPIMAVSVGLALRGAEEL